MQRPDLITVIIPMFNGAKTIERTLASVYAQTWPEIEVIIVDDGSTDDSVSLVSHLIADNPRTRLLKQPNQGVASARNLGAAHANGDFLAFVDADDLWAPRKLEKQMECLLAGGPRVGLVYTWVAQIDEFDRIQAWNRPEAEGDVFRDLCRWNVVGNGSSPLIRRSVFEDVGGYDSSLRARRAQGCEDLMIYLRIAERFEFRVVRQFLTGYRITPDNMSSNALVMMRSCELTLETFQGRYPQYASEFHDHRRDLLYWLLVRALTSGPIKNFAALVRAVGLTGSFRSGSLAVMFGLTVVARTPSPVKNLLRQLRGARPRQTYSEVQV